MCSEEDSSCIIIGSSYIISDCEDEESTRFSSMESFQVDDLTSNQANLQFHKSTPIAAGERSMDLFNKMKAASEQNAHLADLVEKQKQENIECRRERDEITSERDELLKRKVKSDAIIEDINNEMKTAQSILKELAQVSTKTTKIDCTRCLEDEFNKQQIDCLERIKNVSQRGNAVEVERESRFVKLNETISALPNSERENAQLKRTLSQGNLFKEEVTAGHKQFKQIRPDDTNLRENYSKVRKSETQNIEYDHERISFLEKRLRDEEDMQRIISDKMKRFKHLYFEAMKLIKREATEEKDKKILELEQTLKQRENEQNEYRRQVNRLKIDNDTMQRKVSDMQDVNSQRNMEIQILEQRNQLYDSKIAELVTSNKQLTEEARNAKMELSKAQKLIESIDIEKKVLHRPSILSERSNFESQMRLEKELYDQRKAWSGKLQNAESLFRSEMELLHRKKVSLAEALKQEQVKTEDLRSQLLEAQEQNANKSRQIEDLSVKLETTVKSNSQTGFSKRSLRKMQEEKRMMEISADHEKLRIQIENLKKHHRDLNKEIDALNARVDAHTVEEIKLKSHIKELQEECQFQLDNSLLMTKKAEQCQKQEMESNEKLQALRMMCRNLEKNLENVDKKYENEFLAHSADLKTIDLQKDQIEQLKLAKYKADKMLTSVKLELESVNKTLKESRQELNQKVVCLEERVMRFVYLLQQKNMLPSSFGLLYESLKDESFAVENFESLATKQVAEVVKLLKNEKDIAIARIESVNNEKARLSVMLNKQIDELTSQLDSIKSSTDTTYGDLQSNMETLLEPASSKIQLWTEKQYLDKKVKLLTEKVKKLEIQLQAFEAKNRKLSEQSLEYENEMGELITSINKMIDLSVANAKQTKKDSEIIAALQQDMDTKTRELEMAIGDLNKLKQLNLSVIEYIDLSSDGSRSDDSIEVVEFTTNSREENEREEGAIIDAESIDDDEVPWICNSSRINEKRNTGTPRRFFGTPTERKLNPVRKCRISQ
ncbi:hypothetical protein Bhyg_08767 [Pseudolycoriella hygida]|uniref:Uncharacterized protein n=1 Tax=Pseudolycoriella hygida TaxID=35572 RepID=A0A9Q0N5Y8_9DIPT|nr:hypothetical protein Bhyg_08767 [Pseudolycoriella hygida]